MELNMHLENSPFSKEFLKLAYQNYGKLGLFWGSLILLSSCYVVSPEKFLLMKWSYSGVGKTISDKVSLFFIEPSRNGLSAREEEVPYLVLSARLTPAGLGKLFKKEKISARQFRRANLILYEDLSKATTPYLQKTAVSFLAALTEAKTLDDITSEGGGLQIPISENKKKCMLSGTPSQFEFLSCQDVFTEYIDRRSLSLFLFMAPDEWQERKRRAYSGLIQNESERIIEDWKRIIVEAYTKSGVQKTTDCPDRFIDFNSPTRKEIYEKMLAFKRFPENLMMMIDSLAKGHAILNGRNCTIEEDYQMIDKVFGRFLYLGNVKKKEFLLMEELSFHGGSLPLSVLAHLLEERSRRENLPDAKMVGKTIKKYCKFSKYLVYEVIPVNRHGNGVDKMGIVRLSDELITLLKNSIKEVEEIVNE